VLEAEVIQKQQFDEIQARLIFGLNATAKDGWLRLGLADCSALHMDQYRILHLLRS